MLQRFYKILVVYIVVYAAFNCITGTNTAFSQEKWAENNHSLSILSVFNTPSNQQYTKSLYHSPQTKYSSSSLGLYTQNSQRTAIENTRMHFLSRANHQLLNNHPYQRLTTPISLSADHYVENLSFFCRQEYKWEKTTKVPLRIRVGTLQQCNALEGK